MKKTLILLFVLAVIFACEDKKELDKEKPKIDKDYATAFPAKCDQVLYFGKKQTVQFRFTDNLGLGSYRIDIHNNFDHHSHSTDVTECSDEPNKKPVNPYNLILDKEIASAPKEHAVSLELEIPASNSTGKFDEGDYHFSLLVTDVTGWTEHYAIGVKMKHPVE